MLLYFSGTIMSQWRKFKFNFLIIHKVLQRHPYQYFEANADFQRIVINWTLHFKWQCDFEEENSKYLQFCNVDAAIPVTEMLFAYFQTSNIVLTHWLVPFLLHHFIFLYKQHSKLKWSLNSKGGSIFFLVGVLIY